jgi:hypothetical protein
MRPPSGLTNGHGVMSHWKNSNCIRIMSKRILTALSRDFSVGRDLSPKGPHANAVSMLTLILPLGRFGKASLPKILTSTPSKNRWQGPFSERSALRMQCRCRCSFFLSDALEKRPCLRCQKTMFHMEHFDSHRSKKP